MALLLGTIAMLGSFGCSGKSPSDQEVQAAAKDFERVGGKYRKDEAINNETIPTLFSLAAISRNRRYSHWDDDLSHLSISTDRRRTRLRDLDLNLARE